MASPSERRRGRRWDGEGIQLGVEAPVLGEVGLDRAPLQRRVNRDRLSGRLTQTRHSGIVDAELRELRHDRRVESLGATGASARGAGHGGGACTAGPACWYASRRGPRSHRGTTGSWRAAPLQSQNRWCILNRMVQYASGRLDASFAALSDATRRGVLEQLGRSDASITDLAEKFHMTLTGMKKHVGVLEEAGLVTTKKVGRVRTCKLGPRRLEEETAWIERYRQLWDARFDELDKVVEELKRKEKVDGRKTRE
jgi:DNA-binding transcriptional ArsR family regulator